MDNLKARITELLEELEYTHLKKNWPELLSASGIEKNESNKWAAEIGHVVEEYQSSLICLVDLLQETDSVQIPHAVLNWAIGRLEVTLPEIEEPMRYLVGELERFLSPDSDDE